MYIISKGQLSGNIRRYVITIDNKLDGYGQDSFSKLSGTNGIFTEIAKEANATNTPVLIDFIFVKDAKDTIQNNKFIIKDSNLIKELTLPIMPAGMEFEKTLKGFFKNHYELYEKATTLVENHTLPKSKIKEMKSAVVGFRENMLDYVYDPLAEVEVNGRKIKLKDKIIHNYNIFENSIFNCNPYANQICEFISESSDLSQDVIDMIFELLKNNPDNYFKIVDSLNKTPAYNAAQKRVDNAFETFLQAEGLVAYIRRHLAHSYHIANEMINEYEDVIKNLSIYKDNTPYDIMFKPENSEASYIEDVINIVINTLISYGKISPEHIMNYKSESNGPSLYETNEELSQNFLNDIKNKFISRNKNNYKDGKNKNDPNGPFYN